jgi:hypothetical protein
VHVISFLVSILRFEGLCRNDLKDTLGETEALLIAYVPRLLLSLKRKFIALKSRMSLR